MVFYVWAMGGGIGMFVDEWVGVWCVWVQMRDRRYVVGGCINGSNWVSWEKKLGFDLMAQIYQAELEDRN